MKLHNPFLEEENLTPWFEVNKTYLVAKNESLYRYLQKNKLSDKPKNFFLLARVYLESAYLKQTVVFIITLILFSSLTALASLEFFLPERFKPSSLLNGSFGKKTTIIETSLLEWPTFSQNIEPVNLEEKITQKSTLPPIQDQSSEFLSQPDSVETNKNEPVKIKPIDNDIFSGMVSLKVETEPVAGEVEELSDKSLVYTPDLNFVGQDEIEYWLVDTFGRKSSKASITIKVKEDNKKDYTEPEVVDQPIQQLPEEVVDDNKNSDDEKPTEQPILIPNQAPVANNDYFEMPFNKNSIELDVLRNDFDPEGGKLKIINLGTPSFGKSETDDQIITYNRLTGNKIRSKNSDSFTYQILDEHGLVSNQATVKIVFLDQDKDSPVGDQAPETLGKK